MKQKTAKEAKARRGGFEQEETEGTERQRAARELRMRQAFGPSGAAGCSHGWSAAEPVERIVFPGFCPGGAAVFRGEIPSVEHILLIELNAVSAKEAEELGLEGLLLVMFGLPSDIFLHGLLL